MATDEAVPLAVSPVHHRSFSFDPASEVGVTDHEDEERTVTAVGV